MEANNKPRDMEAINRAYEQLQDALKMFNNGKTDQPNPDNKLAQVATAIKQHGVTLNTAYGSLTVSPPESADIARVIERIESKRAA